MTPLRPHLIRAIYEWILENGMAPHLLVNAELDDVNVPQQFVHDGRIILNLRPEAIQDLSLGIEQIEFNARFSGTPMQLVIPVPAVLAIYARENGKGMVFEDEDMLPSPSDPTSKDKVPDKPSRPVLKVVK